LAFCFGRDLTCRTVRTRRIGDLALKSIAARAGQQELPEKRRSAGVDIHELSRNEGEEPNRLLAAA
jgi:hypothetical protein